MSMRNSISARFYSPVVLGLLAMIITPFLSETADALVSVGWPPLTVNLPAPEWLSTRAIKVLSLLLGAGLVFFGAKANFALFFPSDLKMDVYLDTAGIQKAMKQFTAKEKMALKVSSSNWNPTQNKYRARIAKALWAKQDKSRFTTTPIDWSSIADSTMRGSGRTSFVVGREELLKYRIEESKGALSIVAEIPKVKRLEPLATAFILQQTRHNTLCLKWSSVLSGMRLVLAPRFRQVIVAGNDPAEDAAFDHVIVAATKVTGLPTPRIGSTVYLYQKNKRGRETYIPVAYAEYRRPRPGSQ